jgi:hypothetical protein
MPDETNGRYEWMEKKRENCEPKSEKERKRMRGLPMAALEDVNNIGARSVR